MRSSSQLLLGGLAAVALTAGWSAAFQEPAGIDGIPYVRVLQERTPYWDTLSIKDDVPLRLLSVPEGRRFVLTDVWLLSMEDHYTPADIRDRAWLENRREGDKFIIFDSKLAELKLPLRWNTGVVFGPDSEAWFNWDFNTEHYNLRRVHFTGYFEELPAPVAAR